MNILYYAVLLNIHKSNYGSPKMVHWIGINSETVPI